MKSKRHNGVIALKRRLPIDGKWLLASAALAIAGVMLIASSAYGKTAPGQLVATAKNEVQMNRIEAIVYAEEQRYYRQDLRTMAQYALNEQQAYPRIAATSLAIDGEYVVDFESVDEANTAIERLHSVELTENRQLVSVVVEETLKVANRYVFPSQFDSYRNAEDAVSYIYNGGQELINHMVAEGDTLYDIAIEYGTSVEKIIADNAYLADKKYLSIGDEIVINRPDSLINQYITVLETNNEVVAQGETLIDDSAMFVGERKLKSEGTPGEILRTEEIVYDNGRIVTRTTKSTEVLVEPVDDVYYAGVKSLPTVLVNNSLMRPVSSYSVSSRYGYRSLGFHRGIDLRMSIGSPVYAAEAGTVSFSGYNGSYGYLVVIDHGEGLQTCYAHNSKLLVEVGQYVKKGENITLSGNSGNSTGPHLHFEIRINGTTVNPENYLPF